MRSEKILTLIFSIMLLPGCDPLRRVVVKNESAEKATITFKLKGDSALHSPLFISSAETISYTIYNKAPHNVMRLSFGPGHWTKSDLKNLVDDLEYMEITSTSVNKKLTAEPEIQSYLAQHLHGILKKNIRITIR